MAVASHLYTFYLIVKRTNMKILLSFFLSGLLFADCAQNEAIKLTNEQISINLFLNEKGIPYIKNAQWTDNKNIIFSGKPSGIPLNDHLPQILVVNKKNQNHKDLTWNKTKDSISVKAQLTRKFNDLYVTWNYQLYRKTSIIRTWVELKNKGTDKSIPWFPIWAGALDFKGNKDLLKYWDALEYTPQIQCIQLGSTVWSSTASLVEYQW
jgi:hypothetical protein